jgi:DNA-binding NarL/FixJ family response regulator
LSFAKPFVHFQIIDAYGIKRKNDLAVLRSGMNRHGASDCGLTRTTLSSELSVGKPRNTCHHCWSSRRMSQRHRLLIAKHSAAGLPAIMKKLDPQMVEVVAYCDVPPLIKHENSDLGFDVCLIDLHMLRRVHRKHPEQIARIQRSAVVVLLVHSKHIPKARALSESIDGLAIVDHMLSHINETFLLARCAHSLLPVGVLTALASATAKIAALNSLSESERIVLKHLANAHTNQAIAGLMDIPENIVKAMVRIVLAKLNLTNRTEAAIFALRLNLAAQNDSADVSEE